MDLFTLVLKRLVQFFLPKAADSLRNEEEKLDHTFKDERYQPAFFNLICSVSKTLSADEGYGREDSRATVEKLVEQGVSEKEATARVEILVSQLDGPNRSEHLLSFAAALDHSGEWDKAVSVFEIAMQNDNAVSKYARNCIDDIRSKQAGANEEQA